MAVGAAIATGVSVACMLSASDSLGRMAAYVRWFGSQAKEIRMQTLKDTWWYETNAGEPAQKCVETERLPDEGVEAFQARHQELVEAAQKACPPIPPPG